MRNSSLLEEMRKDYRDHPIDTVLAAVVCLIALVGIVAALVAAVWLSWPVSAYVIAVLAGLALVVNRVLRGPLDEG